MNLNPVVLSIPIFFILIGVELVVERFSNRKLYRLPDAIANLSCGITSQLSGLFMRVLAVGVYEHAQARYVAIRARRVFGIGYELVHSIGHWRTSGEETSTR